LNENTPAAGRLVRTLLTTRWYWIGLALLGLFMEGVALYYQYGIGEEPCQICIHTRIWVAAFTLLALVMCVLPFHRALNAVAHVLALVCMVGLWERCKYLLDVEQGRGAGSCEFFLGFPDWFALDAWFPAMFEVRNLCGFSPEMFWGISMAEMLIVVSSLMVLVALIATLLNLAALRHG
jgi:disulfide bond formation protein DsbB